MNNCEEIDELLVRERFMRPHETIEDMFGRVLKAIVVEQEILFGTKQDKIDHLLEKTTELFANREFLLLSDRVESTSPFPMSRAFGFPFDLKNIAPSELLHVMAKYLQFDMGLAINLDRSKDPVGLLRLLNTFVEEQRNNGIKVVGGSVSLTLAQRASRLRPRALMTPISKGVGSPLSKPSLIAAFSSSNRMACKRSRSSRRHKASRKTSLAEP